MAKTITSCRVVPIAAVLILALACHAVCAQSPAAAAAPAPETVTAESPAVSECFTALMNMSDCLTYVEDGSNLTKPDKGCCPELAGLIDSNPICLCQLLGKPDSIGIKINLNKALKLPSTCGLTTPPVSTCSAVGVPVSLPPGSEGSMSPSMAPSTSPSKSPAGSPRSSSDEAAASPSGDKNGASGIHASVLTFIFGLSTLCVSIFF